METKICSICKNKKSISDFGRYRYKGNWKIKPCCKKCHREMSKKWEQENIEYRRNYRKEFSKKNKKNKRLSYLKYKEKQLKTNPCYKLKCKVRIMLWNGFMQNTHTSKESFKKITNYEYENFRNYLLQTFKNNYGYEWDGIEKVNIDHIIPLVTANTKEDVIKLCHYTNLQLLKEKDNQLKGTKVPENITK